MFLRRRELHVLKRRLSIIGGRDVAEGQQQSRPVRPFVSYGVNSTATPGTDRNLDVVPPHLVGNSCHDLVAAVVVQPYSEETAAAHLDQLPGVQERQPAAQCNHAPGPEFPKGFFSLCFNGSRDRPSGCLGNATLGAKK
jgi:hypothetical protein